MNIGNLLVAKGLVSAEDINNAINHNKMHGGRLGDSLVALGLLTKEQIDEVLVDAPQSPAVVEGTGIDPASWWSWPLKACTPKTSKRRRSWSHP